MNLFNKKKSPEQKRQAEYENLRKEAMLAQRGGDIVKSAELHAKADAVLALIEGGSSS